MRGWVEMLKRIRIRTMFIGGCITLIFFVLIARVFWVQVVDAKFLTDMAKKAWSTKVDLNPVRGTIYDRNKNVLALDAPAYTVAVSPKIINKLGIENEVADKLNEVLHKPKDELMKIITAKNEEGEFKEQREVRSEGWKIETELAQQIQAFIDDLKKQLKEKKVKGANDVGVYLMKQSKRYYPKNTLASHLLGYLDKNGKAVTGLEAYFDKELTGTPGYIKYEKDQKGIKLPNAEEIYQPERDGKQLVLTIDETIQSITQNAIKEVYDQYQPKSITAIAADPKTMEILAMANLPNYDPNKYWETKDQANFFDHSIKSAYEPGSTSKILTLASAVQEGYFNPNETYMSGKIQVGKWPIHDIKRQGWGPITFLDGLKRSSNVAFVKLGYERLQKEKLTQYFTAFGFGQKTGITLFGESAGILRIQSNADVATASMGQGGVVVTPLQQITAIAAVANGGKLLEPHLVKEIIDPVTNTTRKIEPKVIRQVISEETSRKTGEYLEQVVADQKIGTGRNAYIEGYRVAGKTGTAQKVEKGKYVKGRYVVSFIGYAPVEDPKIIVYIIMDEPNSSIVGGGTATGPAFKKIVSQSLKYMGVKPSRPTEQTKAAGTSKAEKTVSRTVVPNVTKLKATEAKEKLNHLGISYSTIGKGETVLRQFPDAGAYLTSGKGVYLITEEVTDAKVPDMKGASLRDVLEISSLLNLSASVTGEGYVVDQEVSKTEDKVSVSFKLEPIRKEDQSSAP